MRSLPSACAITLPISVLPTPASPSRKSGLCMDSDRNSEVARLRSATYSPLASSAWVSSIDFGSVFVMSGAKEPHFPGFGAQAPPWFDELNLLQHAGSPKAQTSEARGGSLHA